MGRIVCFGAFIVQPLTTNDLTLTTNLTRRLSNRDAMAMRVAGEMAGPGGSEIDSAKWMAYYDSVSATIEGDAYFEQLLRRCWRIPASKMR